MRKKDTHDSRTLDWTMASNSFSNLCVPVYSSDVNQNLIRTTHVLKESNRTKSQFEKPPLSPLGVSTHRKTPNCTGESVCILKCKYTVLEFFFLFCLCA